MKKVFIFLFFLFCGTYAQGFPDFNIFHNNQQLSGSTVEITYGDSDRLSVQTTDGKQNDYRWCWAPKNMSTNCYSSTTSYFPAPSENPSSILTWEMEVTGTSNYGTRIKPITLMIKPRPTYKVIFDTKGGSSNPPDQSVLKDSNATKPVNPTKTGYDFVHWYEEDKSETTAFNFSTTGITKETRLAAYWRAKEYTIILDAKGGTGNPATIKVTYNEKMSALSEPNKSGYEFLGWFNTDATTGGTKFTKEDIYTDESVTKLFARWRVENYTISFDLKNEGDNVSPVQDITYNIETTPTITLQKPQRCGYTFDGWYDEEGRNITSVPDRRSLGTKTLIAKWKQETPKATEDLFARSIPPLVYNAQEIAPIDVRKNDLICMLGDIKDVLYNGSPTLPKNAGDYTLSIVVDESIHYKGGTILLENFRIGRAEPDITISPITVEDKDYDATRNAKVSNINTLTFTGFYGTDEPTENDYSIDVSFVSPNAAPSVEAEVKVRWNQNGDLARNYVLKDISESAYAEIRKAKNVVLAVNAPENYELSAPTNPSINCATSSPFICNISANVKWGYKYLENGDSSSAKPNRVGWWEVYGFLEETGNYEGANDNVRFFVKRGNTPVTQQITSKNNDKISKDNILSVGNKHYFFVRPSACGETSAEIIVNVDDDDIVFKTNGDPGDINKTEHTVYFDFDVNENKRYDSLVYELASRHSEDNFRELDTLILEIPIPFKTVAGQKWDNVLYINNNPKTNGGYEWTEFEWFKGNTILSEKQFYSAGNSVTNKLTKDENYHAVMYTQDGSRFSTCEYEYEPKSAQTKPAAKAKVILNKKQATDNETIYSPKGERVVVPAPGVYLIK